MSFQGKCVLVTGAATNSGYVIARRFAAAGARTAVNDIDPEATRRAADEIRAATGGDVVAMPADLANREAIADMFSRLGETWGRLDVLVNNAAEQAIGPAFVDMTYEMLEHTVRVNIMGMFLCGQQAARMMIAQGGGAIVNFGSNTAERVIRNRSAYCTTKGAIEAMTRSMAVELGMNGVRVNTVVPGYIHTKRWDDLAPGVAERRRSIVPLGREATGDDIADAVMFLASDQARRITGARLVVDGGVSAQLVPKEFET